jgi:hypothetical protein
MAETIQEKDGAGNGASSKSKRARPVKMAEVQVIHKEGAAALVQWTERGNLRRGIVPVESLGKADGKPTVAVDELKACLPYGEDWTKVKGVTPGVVKALKDYAIWTKEDALANPRHVREAIVVGLVPATVEAFMKYAEEE